MAVKPWALKHPAAAYIVLTLIAWVGVRAEKRGLSSATLRLFRPIKRVQIERPNSSWFIAMPED